MRAIGADYSENARYNSRESGSVRIRWVRKNMEDVCVTMWRIESTWKNMEHNTVELGGMM